DRISRSFSNAFRIRLLITPQISYCCQEKANPGAGTRRGNEETALFDIVNRNRAGTRARCALRAKGIWQNEPNAWGCGRGAGQFWQKEPNADLAERTQHGASRRFSGQNGAESRPSGPGRPESGPICVALPRLLKCGG